MKVVPQNLHPNFAITSKTKITYAQDMTTSGKLARQISRTKHFQMNTKAITLTFLVICK